MYKIVRREVFSDSTFLWEVLVPDVAKPAEEREHVALLTTEYARWKAGKAGIL
jgi:hypothetical protein